MKNLILLAALVLLSFFNLSPATAEIEAGDDVPNLCWPQSVKEEACLHDYDKRIRVLLYSDGHCANCQAQVENLLSRSSEVADLPVTFFVLFTEGVIDAQGRPQDLTTKFLDEWRAKLEAKAGPAKKNLIVAASPHDAGRVFFAWPSIPAVPQVMVIDTDQTLAFSSGSPSTDEILGEIKKLEPEPTPPKPAAPSNPTPTPSVTPATTQPASAPIATNPATPPAPPVSSTPNPPVGGSAPTH